MPRKIAARLLLACSLAIPTSAQTAAEQLQKGIFAQDTQGKLDDAIAIYRQIAASATTSRDTAAQAQYRLAQALLQRAIFLTRPENLSSWSEPFRIRDN